MSNVPVASSLHESQINIDTTFSRANLRAKGWSKDHSLGKEHGAKSMVAPLRLALGSLPFAPCPLALCEQEGVTNLLVDCDTLSRKITNFSRSL